MDGVVVPSIIYFVKKLKIIILLLLSLCDSAQLFSQKKKNCDIASQLHIDFPFLPNCLVKVLYHEA
jgi:hypothetical protein